MQKCSKHPLYYKTIKTPCPDCMAGLRKRADKLRSDIDTLKATLPYADGPAYYDDKQLLALFCEELRAVKAEIESYAPDHR